MTRQNHKRGFNLSSSSSNAVGQPCKGFSLIEAAIVLAVVGAVIGTIWVSAANMYENYKVNKTVEGIILTAKNIQNLISVKDSETIGELTSLNNLAIQSEAAPKDWVINGSLKMFNGGGVGIMNRQSGSPRFDLSIDTQPKSICAKIVLRTSEASAKAQTNRLGQNINGLILIQVFPNAAVKHLDSFPLEISTADSMCAVGNNTIYFTFNYTRINN